MLRSRFLVPALFSLLLFTGHKAEAQTPDLPACFIGLEDATVGVPYFCDYGGALNGFLAPYVQVPGLSIYFTFNVTKGSALPPGLSLTPSGVLSGTPTSQGSFDFSIDINFNITIQDQTSSETSPFETTLKVGTVANGKTLIEPGGLVVSGNQNSATPSQSINLFSRRSTPITYTATATTLSGSGWLSVTPSGTISPFQSTTATVTVDATKQRPGTFVGSISLSLSTGETSIVPVVLTVTGTQQSIILSQGGVYFQAVQSGSAPPPQSIAVTNGGAGSMNFSVAASTVTGGNWLSVSSNSGTATPTSAGAVSIVADSTKLGPGTYYGQIQVSATGVNNSPQTATVVLNVLTQAQNPGPSLSVTGVVMVQTGATVNSTKSLSISNPSPKPLNFSTSLSSDSGNLFFTVSPESGTLNSGTPIAINIQPFPGTKAGVYTGNLTLIFTDPSTQTVYQKRVAVALIVIPAGSSARPGELLSHALCSPTKLVLVATQLGNSFSVPASWPAPFEVVTVDDCGSFMTQGTVTASFSNGDPPLLMASQLDGHWSGTWVPRASAGGQVTITVNAKETAPPLTGTTQLGGNLLKNPSVPVISAGGVVSAASNTPRQPLAPGSYIAVYGQNLNPGSSVAPSLPLQTQLGGTQAILGGKPLALNYAGSGQINALVPFDTPVNTTQQLIVQQAGQLSAPEQVVISGSQPAIFTQDYSGSGYGIIVGYKADGSANFLIDATHPVSAGDVLVIYCTGLGPVDQPVTAGSAGPSSPLANTLEPVTATIGGKDATVVFAGLAPTLTVYQVNLVVPAGVTASKTVPLVLFQAGQQSVPVQIAVQ